jgi:MFS family permease
MATIASARDQAASLAPRARTLAFATLTVAFVMDVLDSTIVNIAIPAIRADLGAGSVSVQWMVAGYSMAFAMLLISGGRMGDVFGYRRMFIGGMPGFTLASMLCGLVRTPTELIVARLVQGATAACMGPQVLALVQLLYLPYERVRALSFFGVLGGLTAVLGPVIGGALIEANVGGPGWRAIFLMNLPIGVAGIVAAWYLLPSGRSPDRLRIDWVGNVLVVALLFALVFPLVEARALGWPWWCFGLLAATVPTGLPLWWHLQQRTAHDGSALIDPTMFRDGSFFNGLLTSLIFAVAGGIPASVDAGPAGRAWSRSTDSRLAAHSVRRRRGAGDQPARSPCPATSRPFGAGDRFWCNGIGGRGSYSGRGDQR